MLPALLAGLRAEEKQLATLSKKKSPRTRFVCQNCGYVSAKWMGRCTECGAWNSFVEEIIAAPQTTQPRRPLAPTSRPQPLSAISVDEEVRLNTDSQEFDRVLGGGIVKGSVVLIGGQPGIGKSTLLLQRAGSLARTGLKVLYVTGEESLRQLKLRAARLGVSADLLYVVAETDLQTVLDGVNELQPDLLVVDSIQTITSPAFESAPGSVTQVRECAHAFTRLAKEEGLPIFLVGHVTKEGYLAGPKVLEHVVDALLLFEGDAQHLYRVLRAVKNRYGSTAEIGVFEMTDKGLRDVLNPSELFLSERLEKTPGSVVTPVLQGSRPLLLEVQALASPTHYGVPQRSATGFDPRRLPMILAVLEKRAGVQIATHDVFVNVAGGIRVDEPGVDLAVALAIASSALNRPVAQDLVVFGEIGLGGEVRSVQHADLRAGEAARLGFGRVMLPRSAAARLSRQRNGFRAVPVRTLQQALEEAFS